MPAFLTNRIALTQLVALALAVLATCHVVVPPDLGAPGIVAAILLVSTTLSAAFRLAHPGDPGVRQKAWWQSRTIWTQIVGGCFAVTALAGAVPAVDQPQVVETVMALVGIVSILLGRTLTRPIARAGMPMACPGVAVGGALALAMALGGCSIGEVRSGSRIVTAISEVGVTAHFTMIAARIDVSAIRSGDEAGAALGRLDVEYTALVLGRLALDAAETAPDPTMVGQMMAARRMTDEAYARLRSRLVDLANAQAGGVSSGFQILGFSGKDVSHRAQ